MTKRPLRACHSPLPPPNPKSPGVNTDPAITVYTDAGHGFHGFSNMRAAGNSPHRRTYCDVTACLANKYNQ